MKRFLEMPRAFRISVVYSGLIILSLIVLNLLSSPGYLWCVYPLFGVLWWPLSVYFAGRKQPLEYALCGTALLSAMFLFAYLISSFGAHPWFLYPILGRVLVAAVRMGRTGGRAQVRLRRRAVHYPHAIGH